MTKDILYLGSQSEARQNLLKQADIDFKVIEHKSDESLALYPKFFEDHVLEIARHKMEMLVFPKREEVDGDSLFVLTADSLTRSVKTHIILGKPKDKEDARRMLKMKQYEPMEIATGCCLERRIYKEGLWVIEEKRYWVSSGEIEFCVADEEIDLYLEKTPEAFYSSGAGIVENFGLNFLKSVNGSYTAIIGLPIFELRQALQELKFTF